jgi:hypothetical protein
MAEVMFDGREMFVLHDMFRREFTLLPGLVRGAAVGDRERARVLSEHIGALNAALRHYHAGEDVFVWPLLLERCADNVIPQVQLMEGQHDEVARLGAETGEALRAWQDAPTTESREALAGVLDRLIPALRKHLRAEEDHIVPLMEGYIPAAEWNEIVREGVAGADPEAMPLAFGMLMYEGDPEVVEISLAKMPPETRAAVRRLGPQAYAAHAERIHGTATPPRSTEL